MLAHPLFPPYLLLQQIPTAPTVSGRSLKAELEEELLLERHQSYRTTYTLRSYPRETSLFDEVDGSIKLVIQNVTFMTYYENI